jgi:Ribosomal protein S2
MNITVKDLLDAGVHFGHQTRRWNPRSRPYIFDHRNGVSIIDLEKTHACLAAAVAFVEEVAAKGKEVLFVATKPLARWYPYQFRDNQEVARKLPHLPPHGARRFSRQDAQERRRRRSSRDVPDAA